MYTFNLSHLTKKKNEQVASATSGLANKNEAAKASADGTSDLKQLKNQVPKTPQYKAGEKTEKKGRRSISSFSKTQTYQVLEKTNIQEK